MSWLFLGCATTSTPVAPPPAANLPAPVETLDHAQALEARRDYVEAALAFNRLAGLAAPPQRQVLQLRAADNLYKGNMVNQAETVLKEINLAPMLGNLGFMQHYYELLTQALVNLRKGKEAAQAADQLDLSVVAPNLRLGVARLRLSAYEMAALPVSQAKARIIIDELLPDGNEKLANQRAIVDVLVLTSEQELQKILAAKNELTSGWVELAQVVQKSQEPGQLARGLERWTRQYGKHPAAKVLVAALVPQTTEARGVENIALVLPFDGAYAAAAEAVRNGFLAAYYAVRVGTKRPALHIYNSGDNPSQIRAVYEQAVNEGADMVIGPLQKESISALIDKYPLPVPTLALNMVENGAANEKLFQFSLFPEDEARQVAERARNDGHTRAAVLYSEGTFGSRLFGAFKERFEQLGGKVLAAEAYPGDKSDYSAAVRNVLALQQSEKRHKNLVSLLRADIKFEPRRRQDINFIFMVAQPRQARLIPPQLNFHHAADLPIYSTSHIYVGKRDSAADRDLNGVVFGDMPWVLSGERTSPLAQRVYAAWPEANQQSRLYAMGVDAYSLVYYLEWLRNNGNARIKLATGTLYLDEQRQIRRQLTWAQFTNGTPVVLTGNAPAANPSSSSAITPGDSLPASAAN
ncbi:MAG: penicillin-binding protein activator [Gammaproteobacteria bacterium]|nr:penicillin-binding protein activator [Gammaproteobacteria bacterium]